MTKQDRHERHLMRQRGAGSRPLLPFSKLAFGGPTKHSKPIKSTPAKSRTPARQVSSARRRSLTTYRTCAQRAKQSSASPRQQKRSNPSPEPSTEDEQPAEAPDHEISPAPELSPDEIAPPPSAPARKAKFHEHLDESITSKTTKKQRKGASRKRRTVTMPRRKRAVPSQTAEADQDSRETTSERAELEEAGLLGPETSDSPPGSRKRKQAATVAASQDIASAKPKKRSKVERTSTVSEQKRSDPATILPIIKRLPTARGKEKLPVAGPLAQARAKQQQSSGKMMHDLLLPRSSPRTKLETSSISKLREAFETMGNGRQKHNDNDLHENGERNVSVRRSPRKGSSKASTEEQQSTGKAVSEALPVQPSRAGKLKSPSNSKLRDAFEAVAGRSKLAELPEARSADEVLGQDEPKPPAANVKDARESKQVVGKKAAQSPKKGASTVSRAKKMFRIKDQDDSGDESWFRRPSKKKSGR